MFYDAFISYSHAKDKPVAAALQSAIQKLGKPWYRRRALRLFRDDTSLSATPHLWPTIEQALGQSRHFLLLASPQAAASKWVDKEVAHWLESKSIDTVLIGLTDGELVWDDTTGDFSPRASHPLPPVLAKKFSSEPKWVDLRSYRNGANKGDAKFTEAAADFAAAIRNVPKDDLLSEEVRQQRRALMLALSSAALLLVLAVGATVAGILAYRAREEAVAQRNRAEQTLVAATETANSLVLDLAQRFKDAVGVPATLIKDILDRARALQDQLIKSGQLTSSLQHSAGAALSETSASLLSIGDIAGAYDAAKRAHQILTELNARNPAATGYQHNLAVSDERLGRVLAEKGDLVGQLKFFQEGRAILENLVKSDPDNRSLRRELSGFYLGIGDAQTRLGEFAAAEQTLRDAGAMISTLLESDPQNIDLYHNALTLNIHMGNLGQQKRDFAVALRAFTAALAIGEQLVKNDPGNARFQRDRALTFERSGDVQIELGDLSAAETAYRNFYGAISSLAKSDPSNVFWQQNLAVSYLKIGDVEEKRGHLASALDSYRDSAAIMERLAKADPGNAGFQRDLIATCVKIAQVDPSQAKVTLTRALDIANSMRANGLLAPDDTWIPDELAKRLAPLLQ